MTAAIVIGTIALICGLLVLAATAIGGGKRR